MKFLGWDSLRLRLVETAETDGEGYMFFIIFEDQILYQECTYKVGPYQL